jgi:site-specific DNA-methyltransferase (adenine-specific)
MIELNKIYNEDCLEGMKRIPDGFVDLTVTSPPYDNLRTYNGNIEQWSFEKFQAIAKELYRVTADGGVVVWVVGDATVKGSETGTSFRQALYFMKCGFNLHDTMIYQKNSLPMNHNRYEQDFEYMFIFSKGRPKTFNPIRVPCKYPEGENARKNSYFSETAEINRRARSLKQRKPVGKDKIKGNVWQYAVGKNHSTKDEIAFNHPAIFPEQLANDHIISWSNAGDVVLDPFMGSGTTAKMALLNNRNYIGFELDEHYCEIANERIRKSLAEKAVGE